MHTLNFERLSVLPLARERPGAIWFYKDPPHARGWPAGLGRVRPPYRREVRPGSGEEIRAAVDYLLTDPARQDLRWERMQDSTLEEPSYLHYDIVWLSVLVQQIGNRLLHWINFRGEPGCDDADVTVAMLIVHAWSSIDPRVKGMLAHVQ